MVIHFPQLFLWGAALSSYQTEGGNFNSDWTAWEKEKNLQAAGRACDHYSLYKEDFRLARQLNLNSLRISFEWARIYPNPGIIADEELHHYIEVINTLRALELKPLVSLHHFTNPLWFIQKGGWQNSSNIDFFLKYVRTIASAFKDTVEYWIIFNEPLVYIYNGFVRGNWPPGTHSLTLAQKVLANITSAYITAYQEIKSIYAQTPCQVSFSKHLRLFSGCPQFSFGLNNVAAFVRHKLFNMQLLEYLSEKRCMDFIGINYYCKEYVQYDGLLGRECEHSNHRERRNHPGWYVCSQGLYELLMSLKKFGLPLIVTENGSAEEKNADYSEYLNTHVHAVAKALRDGVDIRGYLWWALMDNFEWDKGFKERFGLMNVDYSTLERSVRPFALEYAKIAAQNKVEI
jgi:beta-glucosidase